MDLENFDFKSYLIQIGLEEKYAKIIEEELKIHDIIPKSTLKIFNILDIEQYMRECINEYDRYLEEEL